MSEPTHNLQSMTGPEVEAWVRNFVVESFLSASEAATLRNDDDLLTILDSLQVLRIVVALEPAFGLKVGNDDLTADNLGSVERIAAFVARKEVERVASHPLRKLMPPARDSIVVCGAGAAGMAAALSAAATGADVTLLESIGKPGGTVARALIHTIGGLYDTAGETMNGGLAAALAEKLAAADSSVRRRKMGRAWVLTVCPEVYLRVVEEWIDSDSRIVVHYDTRVERTETSAGRVDVVLAAGPQGKLSFPARAVVDATGTAEVVRLVDPGLLQEDPLSAAGGLIFALRGVAPRALAFPRGVGIVRMLRDAAEAGELPASCGKAWLDAGVYDDEVYVKLFVPLADRRRAADEYPAVLRDALSAQDAIVAFLRRLPEFQQARIARTGELGIRDGGRVRGEYCLTGEDVRGCRRFDDAACRCCWPIEHWYPEQGVSVEYLPEGDYYEIPLRALKLAGTSNLWAAGKCLSADRFAHASARVAGACWSMGEAVGRASAAV